jgi:DNA-binding response OmpR family regulator
VNVSLVAFGDDAAAEILSTASSYDMKVSRVDFRLGQTITSDVLILRVKDMPGVFESIDRLPPCIVIGRVGEMERALACGAADYLCEPWTPDELCIRAKKAADSSWPLRPWPDIELDRSFLRSGDREFLLSYEERRIFELLSRNAPEAVPREAFFRFVWNAPEKEGRALDMHVSLLRKKIRILTGEQNVIRCHRRHGYSLTIGHC